MKVKLPVLLPASAIAATTMLLFAGTAQAGTAAYFGLCSFKDRGNNNGGNVSAMTCYAVEGGNRSGDFFYILWKDGVKTKLNAKPNEHFKDLSTGRTYQRIGAYTFVADSDGDIIVVDDIKYTDSRYNLDDPALAQLLKQR